MWHVSCFRNDPDVPTTSDDDGGYKYVAQSESSSAAEAKEEEVASSNGEQERNFKDGGLVPASAQRKSVFTCCILTCVYFS